MGVLIRRFGGLNWIISFSFLLRTFVAFGYTDPNDVSTLTALAKQWKNLPSNWVGMDPCGTKWVGINCIRNRVTSIRLGSLNIKDHLPGDITNLGALQELDLSYNRGLSGSLPASIGNLVDLIYLNLAGCSFSGKIPDEIGKLSNLSHLALDQNTFTGSIPATIGNLKKLYWLDLANNRLTGTIPVSDGTNLGLDLLTGAKHFHFGLNQLSGTIPSKLFNSDMSLIHILFENNKLSGVIPSTLGSLKDLDNLRLDMNLLTGEVPADMKNLTSLRVLNLANNNLNGPIPNLLGLDALNSLDMSNNSFDLTDVPPQWLANLPSLTSLYLEYLHIGGVLPSALFNNSPVKNMRLRENRFSGVLDIGADNSNQLQLIDLTNNNISQLKPEGNNGKQIILIGNPYCGMPNKYNLEYCKVTTPIDTPTYSTPRNCPTLPPICTSDQILSPSCQCLSPYAGTLFFRSRSFSDLGNNTYYTALEKTMKSKFLEYGLPVDSISLHNISVNLNNYLRMSFGVFPSNKIRFDQADISGIAFILSNRTYKPPKEFGPYYIEAEEYTFLNAKKPSSLPIIVGAAVGGAALILVLIGLFIFIVKRRRTIRTAENNRSSATWDYKNSGSVPQLKGVRAFTFDEIKKCTNNFSDNNAIGIGGYGKVYRGMLGTRQLVAVKRAKRGSSQGVNEFRAEIEHLSRVHHKNLVSLVGYCSYKDEQILVYKHATNGTLKESLSGKSGVYLDWKRRIRVALGAAKGIAYLHELANPPIIHRDIKSSNVLLDDNLNAMVSDFGISKSMRDDGKGYISTEVKGTAGYLDPQYCTTLQLNEKSDVYSYGVLLLEIITGKTPLERGQYIVRKANNQLDRSKDLYNIKDLLDRSLGFTTSGDGIERYIDLALQCVNETSTKRPTMGEVVNEVEKVMREAGMNPSIDSASNFSGYSGSTNPYRGDGFDYSGGAP